jgi:hypothetical protein
VTRVPRTHQEVSLADGRLQTGRALREDTRMKGSRTKATARAWAQLDLHFAGHASLVKRFSDADPSAVVAMWQEGTNEFGERLSRFEHAALVERHCELFGSWPT